MCVRTGSAQAHRGSMAVSSRWSWRRVGALAGSAVLLAVASLLASCGDEEPTAPPLAEPVATSISVSPTDMTLDALGDTVRLTATVLDQRGQVMVGAAVTWSSSDEAVVAVDAAGLATAVADGDAVVTAAIGEDRAAAASIAVRAGAATDRQALDAFFRATVGPAWRDKSNWLSNAPLDEWNGVTTDSAGRVVGLELPNNGLRGVIPPEIGSLEMLVRLHLGGSDFRSGAKCSASGFPDAIQVAADGDGATNESGNTLRLWPRVSQGGEERRDWRVVPPAVPSEDRTTANRLTGGIPPELGNLTRLEYLNLQGNELSGSIPAELGRLSKLDHLLLAANRLSGDLPSELGGLPELRVLRVGYNELSGPLQRTLEGLHGLEVFSAPGNRFEGAIPKELWSLTSLREVDFWGSKLSGPVSPDIGRLVNLESLDFTCNALAGPIPNSIGNLRRLVKLIFVGNLLVGEIPNAIGELDQLKSLNLLFNALTGPLPPELGKMSSLNQLLLARNNLSGPIPSEIGRLQSLKELQASFNNLTGALPSELGNLTNVQILNLASNDLSGPIPETLGNLGDVTFIDLSRNGLTGHIPPSVGRLTRLRSLILYDNSISGPLPTELVELTGLVRLDLGFNQLTGSIPPELGKLAGLQVMDLGVNDLTGPIPPEIGNLVGLEVLGLHGNQLSGTVPPELGRLTNLERLLISSNKLSGPLPRELMDLPLTYLRWFGNDLCVDRERTFQRWLANLGVGPGPTEVCKLLPRVVLADFYNATGGQGWANKTNWLTDAPLASWHGITIEDSLVTGLDLRDNQLSGAFPAAIGDWVDLKRLDLSGNRLSGSLPIDLGGLGGLEVLNVAGNELEGPLPAVLSELEALKTFDWTASGACAPGATWFQQWLSAIPTHRGPRCDDAPFTLSVVAAPPTQAAQSVDASVPLIAGRTAVVPVLAAADRANDLRPDVRVTVHSSSGTTHVEQVRWWSPRGIPDVLDIARPDLGQAVVLPAAWVAPGAEIEVEVDPEGQIDWADGSGTRSKRFALDVRELPIMELTIVPVLAESSPDSSVMEWVQSEDDPAIEFMRTVLPVGGLSLEVREPLTVSSLPRDYATWVELLVSIEALKALEGEGGYWYGVTLRGDGGIAGIASGIASVGSASVGVPSEEVLAHELGHNMSLRHAPCGFLISFLDPNYPNGNGTIGVVGHDPRTGEWLEPSTYDLMSYCGPTWISDYHFNKAMQYRLTTEAAAKTAALAAQQAPRGSRLLLWGGVSPEGELRLDPSFVLEGPERVAADPGPYRVEGLDGDGARIFRLDFDMMEDSHGGASFQFLVPFDEARFADLARIELTGPEGSVALDRRTPVAPMVIEIDRETRRIRAILRGESAERAAAAFQAAQDAASGSQAAAVLGETVTLVSYGVPEVRR